MVVLGGVTRLTKSGLSMTDWKFTGEKPPASPEEWAAEFERYQQSPEYKRVNRGMELDEFKFIYWMEWGHRMWGRVLGLAFAGPFAYFCVKGAMTGPLARRLLAIFAAGGAQGLVGWWMVKSGLEEPPEEWDCPRVSPYRLAFHLTSAFAIYSALVWTALSVRSPEPLRSTVSDLACKGMTVLRGRVIPLAGLIATTAVSGAFVAGMDAGRAYNTFPLMNGHIFPAQDYFLSKMDPKWRNFFESTAAVQFNHRLLAMTTLTAVAALWATARNLVLPRKARVLVHALAGVTAIQVGLGITALLTYVPVALGSAHQATALLLFTKVLALLHTVRKGPSGAGVLAMVPGIGMALMPAAVVGSTGGLLLSGTPRV